jgi:hypothetical protein
MDDPELLALQYYVKEHSKSYRTNKNLKQVNNVTVNDRVKSLLQKQNPLEHKMILYRGQTPDSKNIKANQGSWISTSETIESAKDFLNTTKEKCCLFKIHVMPGIRVLNVHEALSKAGLYAKSYEDEKEFIVDDNGVFSNFDEKTMNGITMFETTFSPHKSKENINSETPANKKEQPFVNERIPQQLYNNLKEIGETFEFANSKKDLVNLGYITKNKPQEFINAFWEILQKNRTKGGGTRKVTKKRKTRKIKRK